MSDREKLEIEFHEYVTYHHSPNAKGMSEIAIAYADRRVAEAVEALDELTCVLALTAFKYEGQRAVLQQSNDKARAVVNKSRALSPAREGGQGDE
jgi:hypothetical protein